MYNDILNYLHLADDMIISENKEGFTRIHRELKNYGCGISKCIITTLNICELA